MAGGNGAGSTADKLYYPWGIYVDSNQGIYIVDRSNQRIQFWAAGKDRRKSATDSDPSSFTLGSVTGVTVAGTTSVAGPWSYLLNSPTSITLDPYGFMYILDTGNSRVQKWLPGAAYGFTVTAASMNSPYGFNFDLRGNMVIADTMNNRVLSFGITCRELIKREMYVMKEISSSSVF